MMPLTTGNLITGLRWSHLFYTPIDAGAEGIVGRSRVDVGRYAALILGAGLLLWGLVDLWVNGLDF